MLALKDIKNNKASSLIIIIMMIISMIGVNIIFNLFFDSSIKFYESNKLSKTSEVLSLDFSKEQTNKNLNQLISAMVNDGAEVAYTRNTTFKGEVFDTTVDIQSISSPNIFNYNVLEGRNITLNEINSGNKVAVISKNYKSFCKRNNNKLYINIDKENYEVVGILGNKYSSSYYNLMIFIPYTATPKSWSNDSPTLNINLIKSNRTIKIENYKNNFDIKESSYSKIPIHSITSILFALKADIIYFAIIIAISLINIIVFSFYWINKKKNQISILKAIGYSKKQTNRLIRNELLILTLITSVISVVIYYPFSWFFNTYFMDIGLKSSPIIFFVDMLFSYICTYIIVMVNKNHMESVSISSNINSNTNVSRKLWIKVILIIEIALVMNYSVAAFKISDYVFSTINNAKKIININNTEVIDPFTVSYDNKELSNYNVQDTLKDFKKKGIKLINYVYSVDSSKEVSMLKNKIKNNYDLNYPLNYFNKVKSNDVLPLLYIDEHSFTNLKLNVNENIIKYNMNKDYMPVYAGYDYKKYFSVGNIINGDSGYKYKIVGFLDKNSLMFGENNGSDALSQTNNLNSFFIIPYNEKIINNLPPYYQKDDFLFHSMCNSFFYYKSPQMKKFLQSTLNSKKINTTSLETQMKKFTLINFNYMAYKIFNVVIILLISISGLIGFSISTILSDKRNIGIKIALGFNKRTIIREYIDKIIILLSISLILIVLKYIIFPGYTKLTLILFFRMLCVDLIVPIPSIALIVYLLNKYEARELVGGEK